MSLPLRWICLALLLALSAPARAEVWLVVGDSISAAFGLDTQQGWVSLLQKRIDAQGREVRVVNASVSGDTSAGGLARLPALLAEHEPALVIIELGGNDGLRGVPLAQLKQNLEEMVRLARDAGAQVALLGMRLPPNYGRRYGEGFAAVFDEVARERQVTLLPFFLEGVGGVPGLMQADGIHPTAEAQARLLDNAWPLLAPRL